MLFKEELENDMSTVFSRLRNTKQFWRIPRNNLNCMVDYYGALTWFLTLSPAEWLWPDLNKPKFDKLPTSQLISLDPVNASKFIDNKFHAMFDFLCSSDNPIGKITHYFGRREYQSRGTQHFHSLF